MRTSNRTRLAVTGLSLLTLLAASCSDKPEPTDQALTDEQVFFLEDLDRRGLSVERTQALDLIYWYCRNLTAPISDIQNRTRAAGVEGVDKTNEVLNAATSACRSTGTPTGG